MEYISTRGRAHPVSFSAVVTAGSAPDGGLFLPKTIPDVRDRLRDWQKLPYCDLAAEVMRPYVDVPPDVLRQVLERSYAQFECPDVVSLARAGKMFVMELFHGPTLSFKDIALQFLGNMFELLLSASGRSLNILTATSGDTGSAAIAAARERRGLSIFVMHPRGRISPTQERQMTTVLDRNVFNLAVEGTFDDCQRIMKTILRDLEFKERYCLGTVNSINWARVLSQIVYYFYGAFRVMEQTGAQKVRFAVPTGNFGDIFAGYMAHRMGLPIGRLILATNENDILSRFFNTCEYRRGVVHQTLSPAMDIQVASNFERYLYYRVGGDPSRLSSLMADFDRAGRLTLEPPSDGRADDLFVAGSADTQATVDAIREYYDGYSYLLDPHTAVGVRVAEKHLDEREPTICLATAHPAKFSEAILCATGKDLARHETIEKLNELPTRCDVLPPSDEAIRRYIEDKLLA